MARQKKDGIALNCNIDKEIAEALERYCQETRLSKTAAVEMALKEYLSTYKDKQ